MAWKLAPVSPETQALAGLWAALADFAVAAMLLVVAVDAWAPPQDLPWKPLRLSEPVGLATGVGLDDLGLVDVSDGHGCFLDMDAGRGAELTQTMRAPTVSALNLRHQVKPTRVVRKPPEQAASPAV